MTGISPKYWVSIGDSLPRWPNIIQTLLNVSGFLECHLIGRDISNITYVHIEVILGYFTHWVILTFIVCTVISYPLTIREEQTMTSDWEIGDTEHTGFTGTLQAALIGQISKMILGPYWVKQNTGLKFFVAGIAVAHDRNSYKYIILKI